MSDAEFVAVCSGCGGVITTEHAWRQRQDGPDNTWTYTHLECG